MNLRNRKKNSSSAGVSRSAKPFWKSTGIVWTTAGIAAIAVAAAVTYQVADSMAQTGEGLIVTESRGSSEPSDTAVQSTEERQTEVQDTEVKEVTVAPTVIPATTAAGSQEPEAGQETVAEGDPEEETVEDPAGGTEDGESEGGSQEPEAGQETVAEGDPEEETVEDPAGGTEDGESEGGSQEPEAGQETVAEGDQITVIPDPVSPNNSFLEYSQEISNFLEECGFWEGVGDDYSNCDNPQDTETAQQMSSEYLNCNFNMRLGLCEGHDHNSQARLLSALACPEGWRLASTDTLLCYPPGHDRHLDW